MELTKLAAIMFVPMILFLTVVMPMWLRLHYREKRRQSRELSAEEWQELEETLAKAEQLEQRVATLEQILDDSQAHWRQTNDRSN